MSSSRSSYYANRRCALKTVKEQQAELEKQRQQKENSSCEHPSMVVEGSSHFHHHNTVEKTNSTLRKIRPISETGSDNSELLNYGGIGIQPAWGLCWRFDRCSDVLLLWIWSRWGVTSIPTSSGSESDSSDCESSRIHVDFVTDLSEWATTHSIPDSSMKSLLALLRPMHPELPKEPRTLCVQKGQGTFYLT